MEEGKKTRNIFFFLWWQYIDSDEARARDLRKRARYAVCMSFEETRKADQRCTPL